LTFSIPIPFFDRKKPAHRRLAELSAEAHSQAASFIVDTALLGSLAKKRGMVREAMSRTVERIDELVADVLA
jgi:hypothetical protein